jgi:hypothetical protein
LNLYKKVLRNGWGIIKKQIIIFVENIIYESIKCKAIT